MKLFTKSLLMLLLMISISSAKPIISDVANHEIKISTRFIGNDLFLFGARNDIGNIVIVVRGPQNNYMVRKKENIAGVWLNRKQIQFHNVYSFYSIHSTIPLSKIKNKQLLKNLHIGIENTPLDYRGRAYIEELDNFRHAIFEYHQNNELYPKELRKIFFMGDTLFKTTLKFPKKIHKGIYNAEIYLIADGELVGMQSIPIIAKKIGFEAFVHKLAYENSLFYGIIAVLGALIAGWFASVIFWKV